MIGVNKTGGHLGGTSLSKLPPYGAKPLMWKQHPDIPFPADEKAVIWRFMDFPAFIDLLDSSSLYFSRLDALDDPFEGYGTAMDYLKFKLPEQIFRASTAPTEQARDKLEQWRAQQSREYQQGQTLRILKGIRVAETCWANCWHVIAEESVALWKIYHPRNKLIAVQATIGGLRDSIPIDAADDLSIGLVKYSDEGLKAAGTPAAQAVAKASAFAFEHELRAVLTPSAAKQVTLGAGTKIPVDLQILVAGIRLSPVASLWHVELVQRLIERHGLQRLCEQSPLFAHPEFVPALAGG